ncbi:MAG: thermonuclease family protein [Magnetococcales bacterium]|nr:thermonuclease family protein [Magnetococcales bacterium]
MPIAPALLLLYLLTLLCWWPGNVEAAITGMARVVDGDTLKIDKDRIRLYGIDAPEKAQPCQRDDRDYACGQQSAEQLQQFIGRKKVSCDERDRDRYGRIVAVCQIGRVEINRWMVEQGWAVAYRQYGGKAYVPQEEEARRNKRGIWAGNFQMPEQWRREHRAEEGSKKALTPFWDQVQRYLKEMVR